MATIGGSNIATDGLVLALDAANPRSYVTGSTISNLNLYSQNSLNDLIFDGGDTATTGSLAPDSTNTAVLLKENTSLAQHRFYAGTSTTLSSNTLYTYSIYAKSAGRTKGLWYAEWANGRIGINYDLGTGTISNYQTGTNTLYTSSISSSGNGWYRMSFTSQSPASLAGALYVYRMADDTNTFTYTGNGTSGSYFWGIQIEQNSYMTPYLATSGSIGYRDTLFDLSGNNNSGILINGPTFSSANNGGIVFNGSTQYVDCGLSTFQPTALTLSTWVSRSSLNDGTIIGRGNINSPTELGISFGYNPSFGPGGIYPADYYITGRITASTNQLLYPYPTSSLNTFHNIVYTVVNNTSAALYYDGNLVASTNTIGSIGTNGTNFLLGKLNNYGPLGGKISNALIYNRALTASEVLQNYNAQKSRYNL